MNPTQIRRQKLPGIIAQQIKSWITTEELEPGDRLPNEQALIKGFGCSKGTIREALSALEVEGLIEIRTGPNGGSYVAQAGIYQAARALRNYLHFQHLNSQHIYEIRKVVEVELAASVVGHLGDEGLQQLEENIHLCEQVPRNDAMRHAHRIAELEFHNILAASSPNPLLSFTGRFINDLLRDIFDLKGTFKPKRRQFSEANCNYHKRLLQAYRNKDESEVRKLMSEHMRNAENHMVALEADVSNQFLASFSVDRLVSQRGVAEH